MTKGILIENMSIEELKYLVAGVVQEEVKKLLPPPITHKTPKYLTKKEAANFYNVTTVTIDNYCKAHLIPCYRNGSMIRFLQSDLENCLMDRRTLKFGNSGK